ncbi:hypothetical protein CEV08_03685 [Bartonella tribocorum]|uniref:Uncharacterized protein n=1 Tax=Bartonella tribocorum TaxID=85701 RepID=A0A2M6UWI7_9HYPH|nr:hypothetical protein CEV08_03685 [Bartonella tribocorum]
MLYFIKGCFRWRIFNVLMLENIGKEEAYVIIHLRGLKDDNNFCNLRSFFKGDFFQEKKAYFARVLVKSICEEYKKSRAAKSPYNNKKFH